MQIWPLTLLSYTPPWERLLQLTFYQVPFEGYVLSSFGYWLQPTHHLETCWKHQQHKITVLIATVIQKKLVTKAVLCLIQFSLIFLAFKKGENGGESQSSHSCEKGASFGPQRWRDQFGSLKWQLLFPRHGFGIVDFFKAIHIYFLFFTIYIILPIHLIFYSRFHYSKLPTT